MNLLIGGDLVPTKSNEKFFIDGNIESIICDGLYDIIHKSKLKIFNLELPLTSQYSPINKFGPALKAEPKSINGIKKLNPTLLTLANNHILDHGISGLQSTINVLNKSNIRFIGVGDNIEKASQPYIIDYKGTKIGIYACTETEFSIARDNSPGANPFDPLESLDHINELKQESDYVIVLYHGGKEHYRYPSPYLQKVCRKMSDKGADLVVCQHSHCIGAFEKYNESTIIYGQGNFIFDASDDELWQTSLLISIDIENEFNIEYIPVCKDNYKIRLANKLESNKILNEFYKRSNEILDKEFIYSEYEKFSLENKENYLMTFAGYKRIARKFNSMLGGKLIKNKYRNIELLALQNWIECEAHRELILTFLKENNKTLIQE